MPAVIQIQGEGRLRPPVRVHSAARISLLARCRRGRLPKRVYGAGGRGDRGDQLQDRLPEPGEKVSGRFEPAGGRSTSGGEGRRGQEDGCQEKDGDTESGMTRHDGGSPSGRLPLLPHRGEREPFPLQFEPLGDLSE
jgi:hypothetical protein